MKKGRKRAMVHGWMNNKRMKETTTSPHAHPDLTIFYSLELEMGSAFLNLMIQGGKKIKIGRSKGDWTK